VVINLELTQRCAESVSGKSCEDWCVRQPVAAVTRGKKNRMFGFTRSGRQKSKKLGFVSYSVNIGPGCCSKKHDPQEGRRVTCVICSVRCEIKVDSVLRVFVLRPSRRPAVFVLRASRRLIAAVSSARKNYGYDRRMTIA
jgi:hypothetical protein